MSNQLQIEVIVPYTPQGGGNFSIQRENGIWTVVNSDLRCIAFFSHKDKRKVKRAIYIHISYIRRYVTTINYASSLFYDNDAPSYNDL